MAVTVNIFAKEGKVEIQFDQAYTWVRYSPEEARQIAAALIKCAHLSESDKLEEAN